jgi:hypothetical protein
MFSDKPNEYVVHTYFFVHTVLYCIIACSDIIFDDGLVRDVKL